MIYTHKSRRLKVRSNKGNLISLQFLFSELRKIKCYDHFFGEGENKDLGKIKK